MKSILCAAFLIIHACSSVHSMSMNFGNFFQKHDPPQQRGMQQQQQLSSGVQQQQPPPDQKTVEYEYPPPQYPSESYSEYRSDTYPYNSSSDQDVPSDSSWNATYYESESANVSEPAQSNATTTSTSTSKEHSISNVTNQSNATSSPTGESSSTGVVWNKETSSSSPASSTSALPIFVVTSAAANATDGEKEEVVLGTATAETTAVVQKTIFQKTIDWAKDEYILSILVPVSAGVIFAVSVICTIALCRCCRRCCRRRRFRKKCLPDSVRNLSTSDRKRLLGDMSSDDEF